MSHFHPQIETSFKVWINNGSAYLRIEPWQENESAYELKTEPNTKSQDYLGHVSIVLLCSQDARALATALLAAADQMDVSK
jgi:hypothetical protein